MFSCALICLVLLIDEFSSLIFIYRVFPHREAQVQHYHDGNDLVGILQCIRKVR